MRTRALLILKYLIQKYRAELTPWCVLLPFDRERVGILPKRNSLSQAFCGVLRGFSVEVL